MFKVTLFLFLLVLANHYFVTEQIARKDVFIEYAHKFGVVVLTPLVSYIFFIVCLCNILSRFPILMHLGVHFFVGMLIIFWVVFFTIDHVDKRYLIETRSVFELFVTPRMLYPLFYVFVGSVTFSIIEYFMLDIRMKL